MLAFYICPALKKVELYITLWQFAKLNLPDSPRLRMEEWASSSYLNI